MPSVDRITGAYASERIAIYQAIEDLIRVRIGDRYRRPTYGSDYYKYLSYYATNDVVTQIESDTENLLNTVSRGWFTVLEVVGRIAEDLSKIIIHIKVRALETREVIRGIFPIDLT